VTRLQQNHADWTQRWSPKGAALTGTGKLLCASFTHALSSIGEARDSFEALRLWPCRPGAIERPPRTRSQPQARSDVAAGQACRRLCSPLQISKSRSPIPMPLFASWATTRGLPLSVLYPVTGLSLVLKNAFSAAETDRAVKTQCVMNEEAGRSPGSLCPPPIRLCTLVSP